MKRTQYTCDFCGRPMDKPDYLNGNVIITIRGESICRDVCNRCYKKLIRYLRKETEKGGKEDAE